MSELTSESGLGSIESRLKAPFKADEYEWRGQSDSKRQDGTVSALVLCYVQARAILNRLDEVCGPFGWQVQYRSGPDGGVICSLGILDPDTKHWIWKEDGASNTDIEAVKGGISGALKRAGSAWGIGRLLYNLDAGWVTLGTSGSHRYYNKKTGTKGKYDPPTLPEWAVATARPRFETDWLRSPKVLAVFSTHNDRSEDVINALSERSTLTAGDEMVIAMMCESRAGEAADG